MFSLYYLLPLLAYLFLPTKAFLHSLSSGVSQFSGGNIDDGVRIGRYTNGKRTSLQPLHMDDYISGADDQNAWISSSTSTEDDSSDWEDDIAKRNDGSLWTAFDSSGDEEQDATTNTLDDDSASQADDVNIDDGEVWLDAIASISADEVTFMNTEADRADKVRQMQEWGFNSESISSTLGVNTDESNEIDPEDELLEKFKEETAKTGFGMYLEDEVDFQTVESHTTVERDEETGDPVRTQMVYVDEHSCIGCYNCANVAQSTFFMEDYMGRARVFQQWGDDQETIEIAIETCPVDCIHFVPYEELVALEIDRRDQNINYKARLVGNGGEAGMGTIGASSYTAPQEISGNSAPRCNNCPSKGCKNCPMFGIGKNPYFEKREAERLEKLAKKRLKQQMEDSSRSADL